MTTSDNDIFAARGDKLSEVLWAMGVRGCPGAAETNLAMLPFGSSLSTLPELNLYFRVYKFNP